MSIFSSITFSRLLAKNYKIQIYKRIQVILLVVLYGCETWSLTLREGHRLRVFENSPWSHGLRPKKLSVSVAVPPAPVRVPTQRSLASSVATVTSVANDKGDNEIILGVVHRSLPFALEPRKTPENIS